mmetsp:Transcript_4077/g.8672  ORF Transcript_4077/g.8672 Transcript_4077/m.8672 type:complete len:88 (+) Transcript_4077:1763-2026(+)
MVDRMGDKQKTSARCRRWSSENGDTQKTSLSFCKWSSEAVELASSFDGLCHATVFSVACHSPRVCIATLCKPEERCRMIMSTHTRYC